MPDAMVALQLAAGGNKLLRLFDVATPGRQCQVIKTHSKKHPGQPGELPEPWAHGASFPQDTAKSVSRRGFSSQEGMKARSARIMTSRPCTLVLTHVSLVKLGSEYLINLAQHTIACRHHFVFGVQPHGRWALGGGRIFGHSRVV